MDTDFGWDLCLSSRKELSHEEALKRRSRRSRAVSRCTSPITPSAFWSESERSSISPPAECMWWGEGLVGPFSFCDQHPQLQTSVPRDPRITECFSRSIRFLSSAPGDWALAHPCRFQTSYPPSPSCGGVGLTSIGTDALAEHAEGQQGVHEAQKAGGRGGGLQHRGRVGCHDAIWHPHPIGCCPKGDGEAEVPACAVSREAYSLAR